jgi:hypothetical protein
MVRMVSKYIGMTSNFMEFYPHAIFPTDIDVGGGRFRLPETIYMQFWQGNSTSYRPH